MKKCKTKGCKNIKLNDPILYCSDCLSIRLFGSKENAQKQAIENFREMGIKITS